MQQIRINLNKTEDRSYGILIENGLMERIPQLLRAGGYGKKYAVICDDNVARLYGHKLLLDLAAAGVEAHLLTFIPGDNSKTLRTTEYLLENMCGFGYNRGDAVVALGGGVSGDIAGFVASIFMRGIPFVQIPTTLLAMADSSVGGKTGVNLTGTEGVNFSGGKNLAGTFHQPKAVYIDPLTLKTLPKEDFLNGLSEVIKYGIIYDKEFFKYVEKNYDKILNHSPGELLHIIRKSVQIKAKIVEEDEKENGIRMILNYGHTVGHALETVSGYEILHGQAIAAGMIIANKIAAVKGILGVKDAERINNLIMGLGLMGDKAAKYLIPENAGRLWTLILSDKKAKKGVIKFILPMEIGKVRICENIFDDLKGHL